MPFPVWRVITTEARVYKERTNMMQAWADYLEGLRDGADVVPLRKSS